MFSAIAAWWSGLNYAVRQFLQWIAVLIAVLWLIAVTCAYISLEIFIFLNPDSVSGPLFPPGSLGIALGWIVVIFLFTGVLSLGRTDFGEGSANRLLNPVKKAALYACAVLSITGAILFIAAAATARGSALPALIILFLISIGSAIYSAAHRE